MTARLTPAALPDLPPAVLRPGYDRAGVKRGVLHFGPGAFFRVHQAYVFDRLCEADPRWGITAVSLKSPGVRDALEPQDGLYALHELEADPTVRVIGALKAVLVGPEQLDAVFERFLDADLRIVTMTVTEKGYCLGPDRTLDFGRPDIVADLASPERPTSLVGWLVEGLRRRREAGLPAPAVISCDNLPDNGRLLQAASIAYARRRGEDALAAWIEAAPFPCTMVDSITPATDDALRRQVARLLGVEDAWPVQRERFLQWVIDRYDAPDQPDWASVGVDVTDDVRAWERTKLRLLNGPHSTLAYLGLLRGRATVAEAMRDEALAGFVRTLMIGDIAPLLGAGGPDPLAYAEAVLARFRNPAVAHALAQIAWDGSQKLPVRLLGTIAEALATGRPVERLAIPVAAWMRFVGRRREAGEALVDPLAERLFAADEAGAGDAERTVNAFMAIGALFPPTLAADERFRRALVSAYAALQADPIWLPETHAPQTS